MMLHGPASKGTPAPQRPFPSHGRIQVSLQQSRIGWTAVKVGVWGGGQLHLQNTAEELAQQHSGGSRL